MKRTPLRRSTARMKRKARIGAAARRRVRSGGVLAKGRPSATQAEYRDIKDEVWLRAKGRCEACQARRAQDPDHVVPRSAGGSDDPDNILAICRTCHRQKDAAYSAVTGRLLIEPLGGGRFRFRLARGLSKFAFTIVREWESAP